MRGFLAFVRFSQNSWPEQRGRTTALGAIKWTILVPWSSLDSGRCQVRKDAFWRFLTGTVQLFEIHRILYSIFSEYYIVPKQRKDYVIPLHNTFRGCPFPTVALPSVWDANWGRLWDVGGGCFQCRRTLDITFTYCYMAVYPKASYLTSCYMAVFKGKLLNLSVFPMYSFARAAVTKYCKLGSLTKRSVLCHSFGG